VVSTVGDRVQCEADLANGLLRWWKNSNLIKECAVPLQMKGKNVFYSLLMFYSDSEVDLFT
jgi:hypothetical protein